MNEHEVKARTRKAALIAEVVHTALKTLDLKAEVLPEIDMGFWLQAAKEAGVNPPSQETVVMVIAMIKVREEVDARHAQAPDELWANLV